MQGDALENSLGNVGQRTISRILIVEQGYFEHESSLEDFGARCVLEKRVEIWSRWWRGRRSKEMKPVLWEKDALL
jgi:hypothetical protein